MNRSRFALLIAPILTGLAAPAAAQEADAIVRFVGEEVAVVARLDLARLDLNTLAEQVLGKVLRPGEIREVTGMATPWLDGLRRAGAKTVYVLVDPTQLPGLPVVVVPVPEGADARAIADGLALPPLALPASERVGDVVVGGPPDRVAALAKPGREARPRPELAAALEAAGDMPVAVLLVPSASQRRVLEEMIPRVPAELGGGPITVLSRGLRWATLGLRSAPEPRLHLTVRAQDAEAAGALKGMAEASLALARRAAAGQPDLVALTDAVGQLRPVAEGDRVVLDVDLIKAAALVSVPVRQARAAAQRAQCTNNLKQIGLAMHNYLQRSKTFPPAYSVDKAGKPLLSWRVHVLPFLAQQTLYEEFHLDEPWDSPHNKALIPRMPRTYACPSVDPALAAAGKTTYLAPRGEATVVSGPEGVKISGVTDGTSNTIMVLEASEALAVEWTRPDDWEMGPEPKIATLVGPHPEGINTSFADGSVRFLRGTLTTETFRALLTRNGREVIGNDDF